MRMGHVYKRVWTIETYITSEDGGYSADVDRGQWSVNVTNDEPTREVAKQAAISWIEAEIRSADEQTRLLFWESLKSIVQCLTGLGKKS